MKDVKIFLTTALVVCVLALGVSSAAFAESSGMSGTESGGSSSVDSGASSGGVSSEDVGGESSDVSGVESTGSDLTGSSALSSATASVISSENGSSKTSSKQNSTTSKTNNSNVGGKIDDGVDTSGWGSGNDDVSGELQSVGTEADKAGAKKIMDLAKTIRILIWIPILLIIASVAALIYVNQKSFLGPQTASTGKRGGKKKSGSKKAGHHDQIYRPRD